MTVDVGVEPSLVETSADYTRVVTFNKGSNDISIIDAETLDVTEVTIRDNLNQMRMSPDGTGWFAIMMSVLMVEVRSMAVL